MANRTAGNHHRLDRRDRKHGRELHGAAHNRGSIPRAGYALRFMPSTSHFNHEGAENRTEPGYAHDTRALMLVRGVDRSGKNDFVRGHP